MKINNFDRDTGEFLRQTDAKQNPLEANQFLLPANAVFDADCPLPVLAKNEAAKFNGVEFVAVPDYREITYYLKSDGSKVTFELGEAPDKTVQDTFPADVQAEIDAAELLLSKKAARDEALNNLIHDFGDDRIMQTRPKDESNIRNAIEVMTANSMATIGWIMKDNKKYDVTVAELQTALASGQGQALLIWENFNP